MFKKMLIFTLLLAVVAFLSVTLRHLIWWALKVTTKFTFGKLTQLDKHFKSKLEDLSKEEPPAPSDEEEHEEEEETKDPSVVTES